MSKKNLKRITGAILSVITPVDNINLHSSGDDQLQLLCIKLWHKTCIQDLTITIIARFIFVCTVKLPQAVYKMFANFNLTACADFPNTLAQRRSYVHDASDAMFRRTASLCLLFASAKRHIFGGCTPRQGAVTLKFKLGRDFCTMHLPSKFHHPVYSFGSYRVDRHTNTQTHKQMLLKTSNVLRYATRLSNHKAPF